MNKLISVCLLCIIALQVKTQPLHKRLTKVEIEVSPHKLELPGYHAATSLLEPATNGKDYFLGYNTKNKMHIVKLNSALEKTAIKIELNDFIVFDLLCAEDGYVTFLAARNEENTYIKDYPNKLYWFKYTTSGKEVFRTMVAGEGHGPGQHWYDYNFASTMHKFNGTEYGIYIEVKKNWASAGEQKDVHNGDKFIVVTKKGEILKDKEHFWTASHSNDLNMAVASNNDFVTITQGDAFPFGLQFYNRTINKKDVVWPKEELRSEKVQEGNKWATPFGSIGGFEADGDGFFSVILTSESLPLDFAKTPLAPKLLFFRKDGTVYSQKYLEGVDSQIGVTMKFCKWKDLGYFIVWSVENPETEKKGKAQFCVIKNNGDYMAIPQEGDADFNQYADLFKFHDGDMGWTHSQYYDDKITIYRIDVK